MLQQLSAQLQIVVLWPLAAALCQTMSSFWQQGMAWYRVNAEGTIVSPQEILACLPQGGVEWAQPFCLNLGCSGEVDEEKVTTTLHNERLDTGGAASSCAAAHEGGEWEVVGGDHKRARTEPTAPAEDGFATDDEEVLEGLRAELAPTSPEAHTAQSQSLGAAAPTSAGAAADPAGAGEADPDEALPAFFGEYPLRPRRAITARLELFLLTKYVAAAAHPKFKVTAKWLDEVRAEALAADLVDEGTASSEGLRQVVRAYQTWLKGSSTPS